MTKFALILLLGLSALLGVKTHPPANQDWKILQAWHEKSDGYLLFSAESSTLIEQCHRDPGFYIEFPPTIHSASQVKIGDVIIAATSVPDFKHAKGFYGSIVIPCSQVAHLLGQKLIWQVTSYTHYFAWFKYYPRVVKDYPLANLFNETLNVQAAGVLLILCFLYLIIFAGKISTHELLTLIFSNFFTAIYFIGNTAEFMGLSISMLTAHKLADSGLWIGFLFFIHFLYLEKLVLRWMNVVYKISVIVALVIILNANNGDTVQLGTTVPFLFSLIFILYAIGSLIRRKINTRKNLFQFIGLTCFLVTNSNDVLVVTGVLQSAPILSIGLIGAYVFILLSINERITRAYTERDALKLLTAELKNTNENLQRTQDELIKSEKMAVMGRAVARIAHELNTPIFVARSAGQSIQAQTEKLLKILESKETDIGDKVKQYQKDSQTLLSALTTSVARAAELVKNFKEISTDQINVQKKHFQLKDYIQTSLATMDTLLEKKKIKVRVSGDNVALYSDPGLFYQIIQNLVVNTERYAYDDGGEIDIQIDDFPEYVNVTFQDFGKGIAADDLPKIFDAFFTTGGGSGGTGLGLNIVYKIMTQQLKGTIHCESNPGLGTIFFLSIPKNAEKGNKDDAAT